MLNGTNNIFLPTLHNIIILLSFVQLVLLALLVALVTYRAVSFSGHLHHMSFLVLDMADAVDFWCIMNELVQGLF